MKDINKFIVKFFVFVIVVLSFSAYHASAATLGFSPSSGSYNVGDTINVKVYVSADSKSVNAVSADIKFSNDLLSLSSISKNGSIINLWAQEPSFSNTTGIASFEGVMLNGYSGNSGTAVTLVFKAKASGVASLKFNTASVLANDGNGTEVLYNKGTSSLKIASAEAKPIVKVDNKIDTKKETVAIKDPVKDTTIAISEIKNNSSKYSSNKFIITSPQPVVDKSYSIQIDSMESIIWTDDDTHIFQAPELPNGLHTIKVMALSTTSDTLSGFLNFSSLTLKTPTITYYPSDLYVDQFMVLKGTADPIVDIELTIKNILTGEVIIDHVSTNNDGKFTYVPDSKMSAGTYSIIAKAVASSGVSSSYMSPIQITNKEHQLNLVVSKFNNYASLIIPVVALLALIIFIVIYLIYHARRFHKYMNKKLSNTSNIVSKSFEILDEDADEEIAIFKKIRAAKILSKDEQIFLEKFKKDIWEAERVIQKELRDIENNR